MNVFYILAALAAAYFVAPKLLNKPADVSWVDFIMSLLRGTTPAPTPVTAGTLVLGEKHVAAVDNLDQLYVTLVKLPPAARTRALEALDVINSLIKPSADQAELIPAAVTV